MNVNEMIEKNVMKKKIRDLEAEVERLKKIFKTVEMTFSGESIVKNEKLNGTAISLSSINVIFQKIYKEV